MKKAMTSAVALGCVGVAVAALARAMGRSAPEPPPNPASRERGFNLPATKPK